MLRRLIVSVLLVSPVLLGLAVLPVIPQTQTASATLRPAQVENARTLLGEGSPKLDTPESQPKITGGGRGAITITIPRLGIEDLAVPTGNTQTELDREGIIRLGSSGLPWQEGSNTFIVGHALGYMWTRVPYVFYKLDTMRPGDEIFIKDRRSGREYTFRVYDRITVRPKDFWVTYPVEGKTIVSLQSCTPIPSFENRLIVRAELVS